MRMRIRMMSCSPIAAQVHDWSLITESSIHRTTERFGWKGTLKLIFRDCMGKIEFFLFNLLHWNL